jgi:hypothetical protein
MNVSLSDQLYSIQSARQMFAGARPNHGYDHFRASRTLIVKNSQKMAAET